MRSLNDVIRKHLIMAMLVFSLLLSGYVDAGDFNIDLCRFKGSNGKTILELYVSLSRPALLHHKTPDDWVGILDFIALISSDSIGLASDTWHLRDFVESPDKIASGQLIIDARIYELTAGNYSFKVTATDSLSGSQWIEEKSIMVSTFDDSKLSLSDIEIAGRLFSVDPGNIYDRGGIGLLPNPSRLFGYPNLYFFYYIEIYPPGNAESESDFLVTRHILNGRQERVLDLPDRIRTGGPDYFVDIDSVSLETLPQGSYTLQIGISGEDGSKVSRQTRFFVNRRDMISEPVPFIADSQAVIEELNAIAFLLKPGQQEVLSKMALAEKAAFLKEFWKRHGGDISGGVKTLREVFKERIQTADELFSNSRDPGHRTERGRIYVLYGKPGLQERHPLDQDAKPYEVWIYDQVEGGISFVFVDRTGFGEYELVHSTKRGEINNPDWFEMYVRRSGVDTRR